jgi:hypothetical protein
MATVSINAIPSNAVYFTASESWVLYDRNGVARRTSPEMYVISQMIQNPDKYRTTPPRFIDLPWGKRVAV